VIERWQKTLTDEARMRDWYFTNQLANYNGAGEPEIKDRLTGEEAASGDKL